MHNAEPVDAIWMANAFSKKYIEESILSMSIACAAMHAKEE